MFDPSADVDAWAVIEAAAESMLITTSDLDAPGPLIVYVNPAFERMTGWNRAEIIGKSPRCLQGPKTDRSIFDNLREKLRVEGIWEGEAVNYRKDGSEFVMEWSIVPLRDRGGSIKQYLAVQRDVTARVESQRLIDQARAAEQRADRARTNLARYFPPRVVEVLAARDQPFGPVRRQHLAVLFADIVGFTSLSESSDPEAVMTLLRDYQRRMEQEIFDHDGSIESYIGDAVMATFGVPETGEKDAANALACGIAMLDAIAEWNQARRASNESDIRIGVGLHYGPAVLGEVGSDRFMAFTVIGDTVNTASRLQQATRALGVKMVVSHTLVDTVAGELPVTERRDLLRGLIDHGEIEIRGRSDPVHVWVYGAVVGDGNASLAPSSG